MALTLDSSIPMFVENSLHLFNCESGVSCVLVFVVRHDWVLVPDTNDNCILCPCYGCSTTTCSAQSSEHRFLIVLGAHKLLIAHPHTGSSRIFVTFRHSVDAYELTHVNFLRRHIFTFLIVLILEESWPVGRSDPGWAVNTVDSSMGGGVCLHVLGLFIWPRILDPPNVGIPSVRHSESF